MAAQTMSGTVRSIHKTLTTTTADLVTITGVQTSIVKVTNRHATEALWAKALPTAGTAAITAGADNSTWIAPGKTEDIPVVTDNAGAIYVSIVGNGNTYSVGFGTL